MFCDDNLKLMFLGLCFFFFFFCRYRRINSHTQDITRYFRNHMSACPLSESHFSFFIPFPPIFSYSPKSQKIWHLCKNDVIIVGGCPHEASWIETSAEWSSPGEGYFFGGLRKTIEIDKISNKVVPSNELWFFETIDYIDYRPLAKWTLEEVCWGSKPSGKRPITARSLSCK